MEGQTPAMLSQSTKAAAMASPMSTRRRYIEGTNNINRIQSQSRNRGRIRSRGEINIQTKHLYRDQQREPIDYYSNTTDSFYRLHGEANDASFSYKHDHFEQCNRSTEDMSSPVGKCVDHDNNNNKHRYYSYGYNNTNHETYQSFSGDEKDDDDFAWVVHKIQKRHRNSMDSNEEKMIDNEETIEHHDSRHDVEECYSPQPYSPREYMEKRDEELHRIPIPISMESKTSSNNDAGKNRIEDENDGISNDIKELSSKIIIVDKTPSEDELAFPNDKDDILFEIEKSLRLAPRSHPIEIEIDEEAIQAEAAKEVAYIMELSKSNHYSIMVAKDYNPNNEETNENENINKDKTDDNDNINDEKTDENEELTYNFDKPRHDMFLKQQEQNQESLDGLKSRISLHSSNIGKDSRHPIDVTSNFDEIDKHENTSDGSSSIKRQTKQNEFEFENKSDSENASDTTSQGQTNRSEDLLETMLYRHFEALEENRDEAPTGEQTEAFREQNDSNRQTTSEDPIVREDIEKRETISNVEQTIVRQELHYNHHHHQTLVNPYSDRDGQENIHRPLRNSSLDSREGIEKRETIGNVEQSIFREELHYNRHHQTLINPYSDRDGQENIRGRFRDSASDSGAGSRDPPGRVTPRSEARDEREWDPRHDYPTPTRHDFTSLELEPRVLPFRGTDSEASSGPAHRIIDDDILRPSLPKRNEVENILIDLIRREKFNFALERIRYFPHEAFEPISSSYRNLALHELILRLVASDNDYNDNHYYHSKGQKKQNGYSDDDMSRFAMMLIETNPSALSTPGNGGYLPLHIACSSSFRNCEFEQHLAVIRSMLVMHSEGAQHKENDTGELPLHCAIRWICNRRHIMRGSRDEDDQEDEAIVVFLLMAHPSGATIRDHLGCTPCDILKDQGDASWPIFKRLERCLLFASQLSQESWDENGAWNAHNITESKFDYLPPIDHIEFADTMSGTEVLAEDAETSGYDNTPTRPVNSELEENGTMRRRQKTHDHTWSDTSNGKKKPSPEDSGFHHSNTMNRRNTKRKTKTRRRRDEKWDSDFADKLLYELLDASDE